MEGRAHAGDEGRVVGKGKAGVCARGQRDRDRGEVAGSGGAVLVRARARGMGGGDI